MTSSVGQHGRFSWAELEDDETEAQSSETVSPALQTLRWADLDVDEDDFAPLRDEANVQKPHWTYLSDWVSFSPREALWELAAPLTSIEEEDEEEIEDEFSERECHEKEACGEKVICGASHSEGESTDTPEEEESTNSELNRSVSDDEEGSWIAVVRKGARGTTKVSCTQDSCNFLAARNTRC
mmetsp:Transcript_18799/g.30481  ORF Transcript_18799/g.30481 Transcript_18799/m.30481 type:complete len:183 (-) Transcript_18799:126-674(-)